MSPVHTPKERKKKGIKRNPKTGRITKAPTRPAPKNPSRRRR